MYLLKAILLEIGFIEEMGTTWDNKEASQTLFLYFPSSRYYI